MGSLIRMVTITGFSALHHDMNIIDWIESYKSKVKQPVNVYLNGKCLVFAKAVKEAFPEAEIYYLPDEIHFVCKLNGKLYDIRGNVTKIYKDSKKRPLLQMQMTHKKLYKSFIGA